MSKIVLGTPGAIEQPKSFGYNQQRGFFTRRKWKCTNEASALALIPQLLNGGYSYTVTEGAVFEVEAELAAVDQGGGTDPEVPLDTWELLPNETQKDLLESDHPTITGLSANEKEGLRAYIANPSKELVPAATAGTAYGNLVRQVVDGLRSVVVTTTTMRFSRTVSQNWLVKASTLNAGKVMSNGYFLANDAALIPSKFLVALNAAPYTNSINTSQKPAMMYGWLKKYPQIQSASYNRVTIIQDWDFGIWSTLIYTQAT